jgi:hypothetical protein
MTMRTESWSERTDREIEETLTIVARDVAEGMTPTDAINRNARTAETYAAALKQYGLRPVIPD